jgi:anthranilate synthase component 1
VSSNASKAIRWNSSLRFRRARKVYAPPGLPRFPGGLAGYFGYDCVRYIEPKLVGHEGPDEIGTPDILLLETEEVAVVDNLKGKLYLIVYADPAEAGRPRAWPGAARRTARAKKLRGPVAIPHSPPMPGGGEIRREFARPDYLAAVARAPRSTSPLAT